MIQKAPTHTPQKFKDPEDAFEALREIYQENVEYLKNSFEGFAKKQGKRTHFRGVYPYISINVNKTHRSDSRVSYGFVPRPGEYQTTVTRPDIFDYYLKKQMDLLLKNHGDYIEVGPSETPIPIHFALGEEYHLERDLTPEQLQKVISHFDQPDLAELDDEIANGTYSQAHNAIGPLSLFTAPRVDLSLMRLKHYTGTSAQHFQNYVIFTNYQFYIDDFVRICHDIMSGTDDARIKAERLEYSEFVEPGNKVTRNKNLNNPGQDESGVELSRMPQMPAYHLRRQDGSGITMVNIGVGPSNAKTITDHIAVLRPHAWLMLGHCAGLRNSQKLGDYVLAHGYLREDNVISKLLDPSIPVPALAEIQLALEQSVADVTGYQGYELKKIMRTGTVATIDDRNWELLGAQDQNRRLSQSRAIALDMESGTVAANGFRFRVPYGTLLCVSDKPLHGQLKLPGMADDFYRSRVEQHLQIGLMTMALLREIGPERLHSRKLRSFNEVAFQ